MEKSEANALAKFDFPPEIIEDFRDRRKIPVDFYNKDGQILIHKRDNTSEQEIERLMRFVQQGIYYKEIDLKILRPEKKQLNPILSQGLSNVKLLSKKHAIIMKKIADEVFSHMRLSSLNSNISQKTSSILNNVYVDFHSHPHAMVGLVNIIELMGQDIENYLLDIMVKRAVVAMAIKTRGMIVATNQEKKLMNILVNNTMLSAFYCDISYAKMNVPLGKELTNQELQYIQGHPIMSYLIIAHIPEIPSSVKRNILLHHHPLLPGRASNNYPAIPFLIKKLDLLSEKYSEIPERQNLVLNIQQQLKTLRGNLPVYDEDANILAIASAFASLTTKVPWREALLPEEAVRFIVNQGVFTYTPRIIREFLDYTAMSLCNNRKIIKEGNYILTSVRNEKGDVVQYEVNRIEATRHIQSKPNLRRVGTLIPKTVRNPRLCFDGLNLASFRKDPRRAHYELAKDTSRQIIYIIDPVHDKEAHEKFDNLSSSFSVKY